VAHALKDLLVCVEMLATAIAYLYMFPVSDFDRPGPPRTSSFSADGRVVSNLIGSSSSSSGGSGNGAGQQQQQEQQEPPPPLPPQEQAAATLRADGFWRAWRNLFSPLPSEVVAAGRAADQEAGEVAASAAVGAGTLRGQRLPLDSSSNGNNSHGNNGNGNSNSSSSSSPNTPTPSMPMPSATAAATSASLQTPSRRATAAADGNGGADGHGVYGFNGGADGEPHSNGSDSGGGLLDDRRRSGSAGFGGKEKGERRRPFRFALRAACVPTELATVRRRRFRG
jgi:hypothetical protein